MRHGIAVAGFLLLALAGLDTVGIAESTGDRGRADRAHGAEVFNTWCAPCHAAGPYHPGTQALEAKYGGKLPAALEERRDLTRDLVKTYVRHGVSIMPFFRKTEVSDADLDALSTYLSKR